MAAGRRDEDRGHGVLGVAGRVDFCDGDLAAANLAALLAAFACTAVLPFQALRHLPLAAMAAAVLAGPHLAAAWERWFAGKMPTSVEHWQSQCRPAQVGWAPLLLPLSGAIVLSGATLHCSTRIPIDPQHAAFPARAVAMIRSAAGVRRQHGRLFQLGRICPLASGPRIKVSYDGRRETIYSDALQQLNANWAVGTVRGRCSDRYPTDLGAVGPTASRVYLMRPKSGWKLVYEDSLAAVFARDKGELIAAFAAVKPGALAADGAGMCFP